ncbi:hypothetical protein [Halogeometricum sp. CBA1124]|uniref:hypothetical protein n=1 Tax=Halogeometricum sp. CBA1124 TaxID=2668071 RepID=UPI00142A2E68|nr:hypothetical protein [Halogeometricum sp. CBA1124]MUV56087.1 hypothetical protein [Halogeometricum sp. CBA1124]
MVSTRNWIDQLLSDVLIHKHPEPRIDIAELLDLGVSEHQIEAAMNTAGEKADELHDELKEVNRRYDKQLDRIKEASEVEAEDLKREASTLKKRGNRLEEQYNRWVVREQRLSEVWEELQAFKHEQVWEQQHGDVFNALEDLGVDQMMQDIEEQRNKDRQVLDDIEQAAQRKTETQEAVFEEVERDLSEDEWSDIEEEGSPLFGEDLLDSEDEEESVTTGQAFEQ